MTVVYDVSGADQEEVVAWAEAGVTAFLLKGDSLEDLAASIEAAAYGRSRCSAAAAGLLLGWLQRSMTLERLRHRDEPQLTLREIQILRLVQQGLSNKQIARELVIELPTVKNHLHNVFDKLGVHSRVDALAAVVALGLAQGW